MTSLTRDDIRKVACPECGATPGKGCRFSGAGGWKKQRTGQNHFARMQKAQRELIDRSHKVPETEKRKAQRQLASRGRNHYAEEAEARPVPVCPTCGGTATEIRTRYGIKASCCGLWSWDRHPLVDKATHEARKAAHAAFDPVWRVPDPAYVGFSRSVAYSMLAEELGIPREECHMKMMDKDTALRVPAACAVIRRKAREMPF